MPQQLLAFDEDVRRKLGHALLESVDTWDDDETSPADQARLDAVIAQSTAESEAGLGTPVEQAIAEIRAKRGARGPRRGGERAPIPPSRGCFCQIRMSSRFELSHLGRYLTVDIREQDLVVGAHTLRFDVIREVRVTRIGTHEACALRQVGWGEHTSATDEVARRGAFASAVRALWAALTARRFPFVAGSWLMADMIATITRMVGVLGALVYAGVIDAPAFACRGGVLALVCAIVGPIGVVKSRRLALASAAALDAVLRRG